MKSNMYINTEQECLSDQEMFGYLDNKLTPAKRHSIEVHLLDCEMCKDALEGASLISDRKVLEDLKIQIKESAPITHIKEGKVISFYRTNKNKLAIAASVLIIFSLSLIYNYTQKELEKRVVTDVLRRTTTPDSESFKEKAVVTEKSDSIHSSLVEGKKSFNNVILKKTEENPIEEEISNIVNDDMGVEQVSTSSEVIPTSELSLETVTKYSEYKSDEKELETKADQVYMEAASAKTKNSKATMPAMPAQESASAESFLKQERNVTSIQTGQYHYNNGNYAVAIGFFEDHLKYNKEDFESVLLCGISYLKLEKTEKALNKFDLILTRNDLGHKEAATYYKALALIKKHEELAKVLLHEVITINGEYKIRAEEILNELR